jgi:hypothetical protein
MKLSKITFTERPHNGDREKLIGITAFCRGYLYHAAAALRLPDGKTDINNSERQRLKQRALRNLKREVKRVERLD